MSVKERIKEFIKNQNLTISEFENSIQASNGYVNSISKSIGLDKLTKILEIYPNLSLDWLFLERGEMLRTDTHLKKNEINIDYKEIAEVRRQLLEYKDKEINELKDAIRILKSES